MRGAILLPPPEISSRSIEDDTFKLFFYSLYCVFVLWILPAVIKNKKKMKSITETEIGMYDFDCRTCVFAVMTQVATSVMCRRMKYGKNNGERRQQRRPSGLRRGSATARLLGLHVRILLSARMCRILCILCR